MDCSNDDLFISLLNSIPLPNYTMICLSVLLPSDILVLSNFLVIKNYAITVCMPVLRYICIKYM